MSLVCRASHLFACIFLTTRFARVLTIPHPSSTRFPPKPRYRPTSIAPKFHSRKATRAIYQRSTGLNSTPFWRGIYYVVSPTPPLFSRRARNSSPPAASWCWCRPTAGSRSGPRKSAGWVDVRRGLVRMGRSTRRCDAARMCCVPC